MRSDTGTIIEENKPVQKSKPEIIENIINTRLPEIETLVNQYKIEKKISSCRRHY